MGQLKAIITELQEMTNELAALNDKPMALDSLNKIIINGKEVDPGSIEIGGIDPSDYPDFADAYVEYAETVAGYGLTEAECELLQDKYSDIVYDLIIDQLVAQEITMLDNLTILALGGAVVCAIFVIAELIANWRGWK